MSLVGFSNEDIQTATPIHHADGLIVSPKLHGAYLRASNPGLRESATVPFWEDILNKYLADDVLSVNNQQPVDDTTKAVDVVVQYYKRDTYATVVRFLLECNRRNKTNAGLQDLEQQLIDYVSYFFLDEGMARTGEVYGGVAFGPKIRLFKCHKPSPGSNTIEISPLWGDGDYVGEKFYKDAGNPKDAADILQAFSDMKLLVDDEASLGGASPNEESK